MVTSSQVRKAKASALKPAVGFRVFDPTASRRASARRGSAWSTILGLWGPGLTFVFRLRYPHLAPAFLALGASSAGGSGLVAASSSGRTESPLESVRAESDDFSFQVFLRDLAKAVDETYVRPAAHVPSQPPVMELPSDCAVYADDNVVAVDLFAKIGAEKVLGRADKGAPAVR
eukprot:CAMPEP_0168359418 /NCGR_PEP_ID=MMETSP0228-20121227/1633_1 /TAXON_ID=133427 /ORGANISM="Protoceratium reticulatum, Strain CCCM 535 (=CCMP 1889)" /LENGTH=173 /DNA_ID=CAMNT_0008372049 /DNA_START=181 /DNA_END=701 /DNA_ORIENTATION=+